MKTTLAGIVGIAVMIVLVGCGNEEPHLTGGLEVNAANCEPAVIRGIGNVAEREDFAKKCARRGTMVTSPKKDWQ